MCTSEAALERINHDLDLVGEYIHDVISTARELPEIAALIGLRAGLGRAAVRDGRQHFSLHNELTHLWSQPSAATEAALPRRVRQALSCEAHLLAASCQ